mgnify:CR=1 FL=1
MTTAAGPFAVAAPVGPVPAAAGPPACPDPPPGASPTLGSGLTTGQLLARIGDIPLRRVRWDVPPGTADEGDLPGIFAEWDRIVGNAGGGQP